MICMHPSVFALIQRTKPAPIFVLRCHNVQICTIIQQRIRCVPNLRALLICSGISLWSPEQEPWNAVSNEQPVFYKLLPLPLLFLGSNLPVGGRGKVSVFSICREVCGGMGGGGVSKHRHQPSRAEPGSALVLHPLQHSVHDGKRLGANG